MTNLNRKGDCDVFVVVLFICVIAIIGGISAQKSDKMAGRPLLGDRVVTKDFDGIVMKRYFTIRDDGKYKYQIRREDGTMTDIFWSEVTEVIK